jgi:hypothetical protein
MALLDANAPLADNIQRASFLIGRAEVSLELASQCFTKMNTSYNVSTSDDKERAMHICDLVNKISRLEKIVNTFTTIISGMNEIYNWLIDNIVCKACGYLIKKIQVIALHIKYFLINVKIFVAKSTRDLLTNCITGKGSVVTAVLFAPLQALMLVFQGISTVIGYALQGIQYVLNLIPSIISVPAEGISFYITPKSMQNTQMTIINSNQSVSDKLSPALKESVLTVLQSIKKADVPIKIASIAAGATIGITLISTNKELAIPESAANALSILDPKKIASTLNKILAYVPVADPLPKYENIAIYNPGFLIWLMTGFLPAGRTSFGIPGMP